MAKFDLGAFAQTLGNVSESDTGLQMLPLDKLDANRKNFYPPVDEFDALVESIDANGLLEPLTVVAAGNGRYRLISGHNRLNAVKELRGRSLGLDTRWKEVPCLVLPPMTEAQEQSAIIEGNRQRRKNSALLAEEAQKLTECYIERKKAGEDLPGRIRQRVAEALQVSQTKLAVLSAIRENLKVPGFVRDWKEGRLLESVAYEISKLDQEAQYRLLDWHIESGRMLTTVTVERFSRMYALCERNCPHCGRMCPHAEQMVLHKYHGDFFHCAGCCEMCLSKKSCPVACEYIPRPAEEKPERSDAPEDPAPMETAAFWRHLGKDSWPEEGQLVLLSYENAIGGYRYQLARCMGGCDDRYPFVDPNNDLSCEDFEDFDHWLPLVGR